MRTLAVVNMKGGVGKTTTAASSIDSRGSWGNDPEERSVIPGRARLAVDRQGPPPAGGAPAPVLPELLDLMLPLLRADFEMAETYAPAEGDLLGCGVVAFGSTEDDRVTLATLEPWRETTTGPFAVAMFPGDHFYLRTHRARLLAVLATELRALRH
jgi:thioesterase superfamily protein